MDLQSPLVIALAVAIVSAVLNWTYAKFVLREESSEKVFFKTLASGFIAVVVVTLYINQFKPNPSLHADPFFEPM